MKLVNRSALPLLFVGTLLASSPAWAVRPVSVSIGDHTIPSRVLVADSDTIANAGGLDVARGPAARQTRLVRAGQAPLAARKAWRRFTLLEGGGFVVTWDDATGVPSRIFGRGIAAPGSTADGRVAEMLARELVNRHRALLAPGTHDTDLVTTTNELVDGLRVVGLVQMHDGMRVEGGQVSFRFKNDRLIAIGSEIVPVANAKRPTKSLAIESVSAAARKWIERSGATITSVSNEGFDVPFVLPIIGAHSVIETRVVQQLTIETAHPAGRWAVYVDAFTGELVARRQLLRFVDGKVQFHVPLRSPTGGYQDYPALFDNVTVAGTPATTTEDGSVTVPDGAASDVVVTAVGPKVKTVNAAGAEASKTFSIAGGDVVTWDASSDAEVDAQLSSFIHGHEVKSYVAGIKAVGALVKPLVINDNSNDVCNAYFDPQNLSLNFFQAGSQGPDNCENTGRIADVVYHEFGHWYHYHSVLEGAGQFDGALSEGVSDYLCATITGDSGMGRGFFYTNEALRELDPAGTEYHWPEDLVGEVHVDGQIIGGTLWDLRKALVAKYGQTEGVALSDRLYQAGISGAVDIPSMYPEVLAADDDDGNLENGTPNACEIATAFAAHGLRSLYADPASVSVLPPTQDGFAITTKINGLFDACDGNPDIKLKWQLRRDTSVGGTLTMTGGPSQFAATIPTQAEGEVVQYQIVVTPQSGAALTFPDNAADPFYEFYIGALEDIYCTGFETDPNTEGWTHGLTSGTAQEGADDWVWGIARGDATNGDAPDAFEGTRVFGNDLSTKANFNGLYQENVTNFALTPVIDVTGYETVRLQYRRWLGVEDGFFDHASIYANDTQVWTNFNSNQGDTSNTQHIDREWRFHDVDLTAQVKDNKVQVKYEIASDGGLNFGGWTLDAFCIRGKKPGAPQPTCGDSNVDAGEACDSGAANSDTTADACRMDCTRARCGDGVIDSNESCDDKNIEDGDGCSATCTTEDANPGTGGSAGTSGANPATNGVKDDSGCGCRVPGPSSSDRSASLAALGVALAGLAARARRRR